MASLISMKNIYKQYPNGVVANNNVNLDIRQGEILALVGENGAGKSTLMKILYGFEHPTNGQILINDKLVNIAKPKDAIKNGIGMVHQNFMLIPSFTVAQNVVLGKEPTRGVLIDRKKAIEETETISRQYGLLVDPNSIVGKINVGLKQRVEILKTLYRGADILILDEPTAVLTPQETKELFAAIRVLVRDNKTVIFITHKLDEVKEISDRVSIMRDGSIIDTILTKDISQEEIANLMVGRNIKPIERDATLPGNVLLECNNLYLINENGNKVINNISFNVKAGEILGVAGIEGNGQTELVEILTGLQKPTAGKVFFKTREITSLDVRSIRQHGVSHIPEDRLSNGIAAMASIQDNIIVDRYYKRPYSNGISLNYKNIHHFSYELANEFQIKTKDTKETINNLSGGNIQKVIVARELSSDPSIIIAAQPTRGIDIGSTDYVRRTLLDKKKQGTGLLVVSADLSEVMAISDKIIIMYEGQIVGCFLNSSDLTEEEIGLYMLGVKRMDPHELEDSLK